MAQAERADYGRAVHEAHDAVMQQRLVCPECGASEHDVIGHEVRGVYDGVLYWSCSLCGHAWNRWPKEYGNRYWRAEEMVTAHNERAATSTDGEGR
jgi:transposase-like protein